MLELMSPVGNWPSLIAAVENGADSIYFGVKGSNMRAGAKNFEQNEIKKIVDFCHSKNVKCYLTLNTIYYDGENVDDVVKLAKKSGVDQIICWDFKVIELCKKHSIDFCVSTQASVSNFDSFKFYSGLGASTIVLARELSLKQIKEIVKLKNELGLKTKIEVFIHGAMCVSVSGRCFMSQFLFCKSANRGECLQPCRRSYDIIDKETGDTLMLENNFVMSPKDLATIDIFDQIMSLGVDILKIEGRNRSPEYVANSTKAYRGLIDGVLSKEDAWSLVKDVYNRKFNSGFYEAVPYDGWTDIYGSDSKVQKKYIGKVKNYFRKVSAAEMFIEVDGFSKGDKLMVQGNKTGVYEFNASDIQINGDSVEKCVKGDRIGFKVDKEIRQNDKVFKLSTK